MTKRGVDSLVNIDGAAADRLRERIHNGFFDYRNQISSEAKRNNRPLTSDQVLDFVCDILEPEFEKWYEENPGHPFKGKVLRKTIRQALNNRMIVYNIMRRGFSRRCVEIISIGLSICSPTWISCPVGYNSL